LMLLFLWPFVWVLGFAVDLITVSMLFSSP
jgi:hypothetical protein